MFKLPSAAKWFCICLCSLFLTSLARPSHAVLMKVTGGFDSVAKSGSWTPFAVELRNTESGTVEGTLNIVQGDWSVPICTTGVNLPANSTKLYHIYARLKEYGDVRVVFRSGDRDVSIIKATINFADPADRTVVSVGPRSSQLSFLNREKLIGGPRSASGSAGVCVVGSVSAAELPDKPAAYEGVDVLVISDLTVASTNPRALSAIGMWVASGGTLVISTGPDYRKYQNEFCDELLPVKITGAADVSSSSSLQQMGQGAFPAVSMAVANSSPKPGIATKVVLESGIPVYAERDYGAGNVVFLAFDHMSSPFKDWDGQVAFWQNIISSGSRSSLVKTEGKAFLLRDRYGSYNGNAQQQSGLVSVVQENHSIKMPEFSTIALFLLGYIIVLVPVNYYVLNKLRRKEMAWVTTPVIVIVFTIGAYGIGYTMKGGKLQVNQAVFIQGSSNARYASAITEATVFSPASRTYKATLADPYALGQALGSADEQQYPSAEVGEGLTLDRLQIAMWSSKTLESCSGVDLGGRLETNLTVNGSELTGTLRNNTVMDLTDCMLVWGGTSMLVRDIRRGGAATVGIDQKSGSHALSPPPEDAELKERCLSFAGITALSSGRPMLLARCRDDKLFDVGRRAHVESCSYIAFDLDYGVGDRFSLDYRAVKGRITATSGGSRSEPGMPPAREGGVSMALYSSGWAIASYQLPVPAGCAVTEMRVVQFGDPQSAGPYPPGAPGMPASPGMPPMPDSRPFVSASVYNYSTGKWDAAAFAKNLSHPQQYLSADNTVRVKVKAKSNSGQIGGRFGISAKGQRVN